MDGIHVFKKVNLLVSRLTEACALMAINGRSPDTIQIVYNRGIERLRLTRI